jgi:hypothetical protein
MTNKTVKALRNINSMLTVGMPINAYDQMHIINRASNELESLIKECEEQVTSLQESTRDLRTVRPFLAPSWIRVEDSLPEDGVHVFVRRRDKFCERAELSSLYFDGLPAWYLPEGPVFALGWDIPTQRDVTHWMHIPEV